MIRLKFSLILFMLAITIAPTFGQNLKTYYTKMNSGESWESAYRMGKYADIMVEFSEDEKFYFWHASSYLPRWETATASNYVDQAPITFSGDGTGLRWDEMCRHSQIRIISKNNNQVVIHWRYAPNFEIGSEPSFPTWDGWIDEYYTISSDKTIMREIFVYDTSTKHTYNYTLNNNGTISEDSQSSSSINITTPEFNSAILPSGPDLDFGASYTKLGYSGPYFQNDAPSAQWNNNWQNGDHPDVVVNFDNSSKKWVFWRGASYVPHMVSDNDIWFTNEFNEGWNLNWEGGMDCDGAYAGEPMNDKANRYAHVRIIENTAARIVVHYRYGLSNTCSELGATQEDDDGWRIFSDFIYYIYPDGYASQHNTLWSKLAAQNSEEFEWNEFIVTNHPGTGPSDNIETSSTVRYGNINGQFNTVDWSSLTQNEYEPFNTGVMNANIHSLNLKNTDIDPFTIVESGDEITYIAAALHDDPNNNSPFDQWNHYPINIHHSFGELAFNNTEASHTPTGNVYAWPDYETGSNFASKVLLTGMDDLSDTKLTQLARSWDRPSTISQISGATSQGYNKSERAFHLTAASDNISFTLNSSESNPAFNPAFVIKNWTGGENIALLLNGSVQTIGTDFEQGIITDIDGTETLILWLEKVSTVNQVISISNIIVSSEDIGKQAFTISPNPASDYLIIKGDLTQVQKIQIADTQGREFNTNKVTSQKEMSIKTSGLKSGIYFLIGINNTNSKIFSQKFIKE